MEKGDNIMDFDRLVGYAKNPEHSFEDRAHAIKRYYRAHEGPDNIYEKFVDDCRVVWHFLDYYKTRSTDPRNW